MNKYLHVLQISQKIKSFSSKTMKMFFKLEMLSVRLRYSNPKSKQNINPISEKYFFNQKKDAPRLPETSCFKRAKKNSATCRSLLLCGLRRCVGCEIIKLATFLHTGAFTRKPVRFWTRATILAYSWSAVEGVRHEFYFLHFSKSRRKL